ncbi:MAG TPA: hypothetical protein VMN81_00005, partial [Vicinamibacterales bacterium]|nr:hypothetical protein [Vicinamibacterales bacterium]
FITDGPAGDMPMAEGPDIECRYKPKTTSGTTPKFDCELPGGDVVKVKYGINPEIPGEVAAARLLTAMGLAADHMSIAKRVRCYGCPRSPYRSRQVAEWFFVADLLDQFLDDGEYADFANVAIERKFDARAFEVDHHEGWAFYELKAVDPARGGASRAEIDALRLVAVFLAHWDNKSSNQRLICLGDDGKDSAEPCDTPVLMLQDVGATFGPRKVDYLGWKQAPIWRDAQGCAVSMTHLPYRGATFEDVEISEEGRQLAAARLGAFGPLAIANLFLSSHFPDAETGRLGTRNVQPWVDVFQEKVAALTSRTCAPAAGR